MPTTKQIQNAMSKLKKTPKTWNNSPKKPNKYTYMIITNDPRVKKNKEFLKSVTEYMKNRR